MLQSGSALSDPECLFCEFVLYCGRAWRLCWPLTLAGVVPNLSWARDFRSLIVQPCSRLEPTSLCAVPALANGTPPAITPRPQLRELCYMKRLVVT